MTHSRNPSGRPAGLVGRGNRRLDHHSWGRTRWRTSTFARKCQVSSSARTNSGSDTSERFSDPVFAPLRAEINRILDAAWQTYSEFRKAPHTRRAGSASPIPNTSFRLDWIAASDRIKDAERQQNDPASPSRILLINGASRSEHTCPGEIIKDLAAGGDGARDLCARAAARGRGPRSQPADLRIRTHASIPARPASRPRCRSATGRAPAIRTTRSARCRTG